VCAQHEHEQIVADGELVIVHRCVSGLRSEEPDRCGLRSRSCSWDRLRGHSTQQQRSPLHLDGPTERNGGKPK
jgi:hypothetical protein